MKYTAATLTLLSTIGTGFAIEMPKLRGATSVFKGVSNEYQVSTDEPTSCTPANFSPNSMYDLPASACANKSEMDLWDLETALFRLFTVQSSRIYQSDRLWCDGSWQNGGIPHEEGVAYRFDNFAVHVVSLLDTIQQLQLLPDKCLDLHEPLRELLLPSRDTSNISKEDVLDIYTPEPSTKLEWWEEEFLPTVAAAFSCGFTDEDKNIDINTLPSDIREDFNDNLVIQQVWRLTKGYLRSGQKQRERAREQQDFDVSLYVPFLPVDKARVYLGEAPRPDGTYGSNLRVGLPTYQGPAIWFLWHTIGARVVELENECSLGDDDVNMGKILSTVTNTVLYFGLTHPCPYCRYHFMNRVSRNDVDWNELGDINQLTRDGEFTSEAALYPLEYLFLGGIDGATLEDKLASVTDGSSLMLLFWKMHNAVTSSVNRGITCNTQEQADDPSFACSPDGSSIVYAEGTVGAESRRSTTRLLGRAWPTASRYQFWLSDTETYENGRDKLEEAHVELNRLDRKYGTALRDSYWTRGDDKDSFIDAAQEVMDAVAKLDEAMLESGLLYTEYVNKANEPMCDSLDKALDIFEPLDVPSPLDEDGNFPFLPDGCMTEEEHNPFMERVANQCQEDDEQLDEE